MKLYAAPAKLQHTISNINFAFTSFQFFFYVFVVEIECIELLFCLYHMPKGCTAARHTLHRHLPIFFYENNFFLREFCGFFHLQYLHRHSWCIKIYDLLIFSFTYLFMRVQVCVCVCVLCTQVLNCLCEHFLCFFFYVWNSLLKLNRIL